MVTDRRTRQGGYVTVIVDIIPSGVDGDSLIFVFSAVDL